MSDNDSSIEYLAVFGSCIGFILLFVLVMVTGTIWEGFVLTKLWKWFMVPVFGLPVLSIVQAIGVSIVISMTAKASTYNLAREKDKKSPYERVIDMLVVTYIVPAMFLAMGWIVQMFMPVGG